MTAADVYPVGPDWLGSLLGLPGWLAGRMAVFWVRCLLCVCRSQRTKPWSRKVLYAPWLWGAWLAATFHIKILKKTGGWVEVTAEVPRRGMADAPKSTPTHDTTPGRGDSRVVTDPLAHVWVVH